MRHSTYDEHMRAIAAVGVPQVEYDNLVPTRKRTEFERDCRTQCAGFLRARGLSDEPHTFRNQFLGFVDRMSQGVWCAWTDALTFAPHMPADSAIPSSELFSLMIGSRGFADTAADVRAGRMSSDVALRWEAWQAALEFWLSIKAAQH